jgi:N-acyl-phosphatidylethanolamine-hydrolysing phospholipase D
MVNPRYDPARPHHTARGFRNVHTGDAPKGLLAVARWRLSSPCPVPPPGGWAIPVTQPLATFLRMNRTIGTFTWIGHATVLLQIEGLNVLTDPILSERASPVQWAGPRRRVPVLALEELPRIDLALISHNHYDHLDRATVYALARQSGGSPRFVVPLGMGRWFDQAGIAHVEELDWWESVEAGPLRVHSVPAQHWSGRVPTFDYDATLWCGFVVESRGYRFLYTGDTGYSPHAREIGERFDRFDLAAIPIGGYEPRWFMREHHVNPEEAVEMHRELRARHSLGIHWGTFMLTDEPFDEPPKRFHAAARARGLDLDAVFTMAIGETRLLAEPGRRWSPGERAEHAEQSECVS